MLSVRAQACKSTVWLQVLQEYAHDAYGPAAGQGWTKDAAAYLCMLRVVVDMQLSGAGESDPHAKQRALQAALRKWVLETRAIGAACY